MSQYVRTVQRVVDASPQEIFELLAHPGRHAEFDGSGTVGQPAAGPERLELGSRFGMSMSNRVSYTSSNVVVEFEPGRRIAWRSGFFVGERLVAGGQIWRYELDDRGDGSTLVKESYDLTSARPRMLLDRAVGARTMQDMSATLERLAALFQH